MMVHVITSLWNFVTTKTHSTQPVYREVQKTNLNEAYRSKTVPLLCRQSKYIFIGKTILQKSINFLEKIKNSVLVVLQQFSPTHIYRISVPALIFLWVVYSLPDYTYYMTQCSRVCCADLSGLQLFLGQLHQAADLGSDTEVFEEALVRRPELPPQ